MRLRFALVSLMFVGVLALAACNGGSPTQSAPASGNSLVNIELNTNPESPATGQVELLVTVTDAAGKPVDNAEVSLLASHTEHSGMDMNGKAAAQGNGRYAITADFGMSGKWLVTVEVRGVGADVVRKDFDLALK